MGVYAVFLSQLQSAYVHGFSCFSENVPAKQESMMPSYLSCLFQTAKSSFPIAKTGSMSIYLAKPHNSKNHSFDCDKSFGFDLHYKLLLFFLVVEIKCRALYMLGRFSST